MEGLDILFIVIGLACVVISFFLTEKLSGGKKQEERLLEKLKQEIMEEIRKQENLDQILADVKVGLSEWTAELSENILLETKDRMNQITNEKMLAFGEYSDQVLEKIQQDHTEVVFLYDMLKEKESTLRDFSARVDGIRMQAQELLEQAEGDVNKKTVSGRSGSVKKDTLKQARTEMDIMADKADEKSGKNAGELTEHANSTMVAGQAAVLKQVMPVENSGSNQNEKILQLYRDGKSVMEISKSLDLGQGEVKLVIDLFQESQ